jgi:hypothetical protein
MPIKNVDFREADYILNYHPVIEFVEPEQAPGEYESEELDAPITIEDARQETEEVIKGYKAVGNLAKISQERIDSRVRAAGGVEMLLDPIKDSQLVAAIKRQFPEEDGSRVTYDMYKECLRRMSEAAPEAPVVQRADIQEALQDPLRTNFGGLENPAGANRPEIAAPVDIVKPIDLDKFKESSKIQLLKVVFPFLFGDD